MSLGLLAPLGLAALAALALPLAIHLVRRLELTTTEFAALRWIGERIRPQRRLRFERPWLLLLRLGLLALLAVLLARPVWNRDAVAAPSWVVVAPGVALADARAAVDAAGADWRWLAPDFPRLDTAPPAGAVPLASLLRELDADLPKAARLTVVVPEQVDGLDGERPRLSREVGWRVVAGRMPAPPAAAPPHVRLAVRYAPDAEAALRYLRAAVAAWNENVPGCCELDAQSADSPPAGPADWLVWLGPRTPALQAWLERGGTALVANAADVTGAPLWRDAFDRVLAREAAVGQGRMVALPGAFVPDVLPILLDAGFPQRLRTAFAPLPDAPTRAPAAAARPLVDAGVAAAPARTGAATRPLDGWIGLLVAVLFAFERFVATRARSRA